jgi:hypothetical protein
MVSTTTIGHSIPVTASAAFPAYALANHRRRITPQAGHSMEKLGHAIEYLTDEFAHRGGSCSAPNAHVEAVELLMVLNRQVYFECPEIPSLKQRFRSLLGLPQA